MLIRGIMTRFQDLTELKHQFDAYTGYYGRTSGSNGFEAPVKCINMYGISMAGLKDLTGSKYQYHAYTGCFDGTSGSHRLMFETQIRSTFHMLIHLRGILTRLKYLKGLNHQFDAFTGYFDGTSRSYIFEPLFTRGSALA